jgi:hypothetical protein
MKRLRKQAKAYQQPRSVRQETIIRLNSKSLQDVGSYPYPKRSQQILSGENQESQPAFDAVDLEEHTLSTLRSSELQMPTVIFVYPTQRERLHLEDAWLERQVQIWENEGGRP